MVAAIYAALILMLMVAVPRDSEAEGAWVLWPDEPQPRGARPQWSIVSAHQGQRECESALGKELEWYSRRGGDWKVEVEDKTVYVPLMGGGRLLWVRFVCIPDTIDPRGSKGGGR